MSAELAARRTAAAAVLADFRHESDACIDDPALSTAQPDYTKWAYRLAAELASLLRRLDDEGPISELAEAITEARALRALVAEILAGFGDDGYWADHEAPIANWRQRAGLEAER